MDKVTRPKAGDAQFFGLAPLHPQAAKEFHSQITGPTRTEPLTASQALRFLDSIRAFPVQELTLAVFRAVVAISRQFRLSYWDGAILAAARESGCKAVYSEDLSDEQDYGGLQVIDPFR